MDPHQLGFGIKEPLAAVQSEIAGQHIGHRRGYGKEREPLPAEQLKAQHQAGQGAVDHAAEDGYEPQRGAEARRKAQQWRGRAAEGGPHKKHRHDLSAPETGPQGQRRKQDLQKERFRPCFPGDGLGHDSHPGAVIIGGPQQEGEACHQKPPDCRPDQGIGEKTPEPMGRAVDRHAEEDADAGAEQPQSRRLDRCFQGKGRDVFQGKGGRGRP